MNLKQELINISDKVSDKSEFYYKLRKNGLKACEAGTALKIAMINMGTSLKPTVVKFTNATKTFTRN